MITKVFLINWICILFVAYLDANVWDGYIASKLDEKGRFSIAFIGWIYITVSSVPAYLIYLIITMELK